MFNFLRKNAVKKDQESVEQPVREQINKLAQDLVENNDKWSIIYYHINDTFSDTFSEQLAYSRKLNNQTTDAIEIVFHKTKLTEHEFPLKNIYKLAINGVDLEINSREEEHLITKFEEMVEIKNEKKRIEEENRQEKMLSKLNQLT